MTKEDINKLVKLLLENRSDYVWYNSFDECYETDEEYLHYLITTFNTKELNAGRAFNNQTSSET